MTIAFIILAFALGCWVGAGWRAIELRQTLARERELQSKTGIMLERLKALLDKHVGA